MTIGYYVITQLPRGQYNIRDTRTGEQLATTENFMLAMLDQFFRENF